MHTPSRDDRRMSYRIKAASAAQDVADARRLIRAYTDALGIDLAFQDLEGELANLPGQYSPPDGAVLIGRDDSGAAIGCVGLRKIGAGVCEMKRLYVAPQARKTGLGRALSEAIIGKARAAGYREMRLDTISDMAAAIGVYRALGFRRIPPYYETPVPDTVFMSLSLVS